MGKIKTFLNVLRSNPKEIPELAVGNLTAMGLLNWMPDEAFLKLRYWAVKQRKLDLKDPKTFNEKLQWLKLHNRKPEYTMMVDKYRVREYWSAMISAPSCDNYMLPRNRTLCQEIGAREKTLPIIHILPGSHRS